MKKPNTKKGKYTQLETKEPKTFEYFVVSFMHIDPNQGDNFIDWQKQGILAHAMSTLAGYCCNKLISQVDKKKFVIYGDFPSKSSFIHPKHVPEDAEWARIHVGGKQVIGGHIVGNIFFVVFLDSNHKFYLSEKKHT